MKTWMLGVAGGLVLLPAGALVPAGAMAAGVKAALPEQKLHIEAVGEVPPDTARFTVTLQAAGATREAAQAALAEQRAAIAGDLAKLGVAAGDMAFVPAAELAAPGTVTVVVHAGSADEAARRIAQAEADAKAGKSAKTALLRDSVSASGVLSVILRDLARQDDVAAALSGGHGFALTQGVRLYARDPAGAHRAAVAQALARAKNEAEIYAAALGVRILRVEAVSNAKPGLSASDLVSTLARVDGAGRTGRAEVLAGTSFAAVAMDYVVAP